MFIEKATLCGRACGPTNQHYNYWTDNNLDSSLFLPPLSFSDSSLPLALLPRYSAPENPNMSLDPDKQG